MSGQRTEEQRRRRLLWGLLGLLVLSLVAGLVGALLGHHTGHRDAGAAPHHRHELLRTIFQLCFTLGIPGLAFPVLRDHRAARRIGTPRQQSACAHMGQAERRRLLRQARSGRVDADDPALQLVVVRREYLRTRAGQALFPLLTAQECVTVLDADHAVIRWFSGIACVLIAAGSIWTWRYVAQLRRFVRDPGARFAPPDRR